MNYRDYDAADFLFGGSRYQGESNGLFLYYAVICTVIFLASMFFTIQAKQTERWLPARGSVVRDSERVFEYQYAVDGKSYSSHQISPLGFITRMPQMSLDNSEKFRHQGVVTAYYDPKHPDSAVLTPGVPALFFIALFASLALGVFCFLSYAGGATLPSFSQQGVFYNNSSPW